MFSAVKNAKAVLISYFHSYNSFSYAVKKIMAYVNQLLDQPSQWQTSQQAGSGSVPKFTSTSITVKQLLIKNKNINQSKSSLLIWHYVSYLFLFILFSFFFFFFLYYLLIRKSSQMFLNQTDVAVDKELEMVSITIYSSTETAIGDKESGYE